MSDIEVKAREIIEQIILAAYPRSPERVEYVSMVLRLYGAERHNAAVKKLLEEFKNHPRSTPEWVRNIILSHKLPEPT